MWLLSACVTMGAALCGRFGWVSALAGGALGAAAYSVRLKRGEEPAALEVLQTIWLAVPLGIAAKSAAALFSGHSFYVPAVVLALSWLLSRHPRQGVLACCTLVGFFVLAAVGIVSAFSLPDLHPVWLRPAFDWQETLIVLAICSAGMLLCRGIPGAKPSPGWRWAAYLAPAGIAAIVGGCLSRPLAQLQASAFYTLSRSISLFGVAERFEALIASCLLLGLCSVCALIFSAAKKCGSWTWTLIVPALILTQVSIPPLVVSAGTVALWVLAPTIFSRRNG